MIAPILVPALFLSLLLNSVTANDPAWMEAFPPHKIAGNLYYVGSEGLASFLVATPQGHILINSNLESSVPQIERSVRRLGFKFEDVKILLISHAHFDHCAGSKLIQQKTHARYMVMDADVAEVQDGGHSDFQYANRSGFLFPMTKVDHVLHDGDTVSLGGTVLTAHLTPGHTKGCTTWTMRVSENGKTQDVVIVGSPNVNPGYKLVHNSLYPNIAADYAKCFRVMEALKCDIFLGAHGEYYGLEVKYPSRNFVDPDGYRAYVADRKKAFEEELSRQLRQQQVADRATH